MRATIICCLLMLSLAASAEPWLIYERIHSGPAVEDRTIRVAVDAAGTATVHRPFYMLAPGEHRVELTPAQLEQLQSTAKTLAMACHTKHFVIPKSPDNHYVADADQVRYWFSERLAPQSCEIQMGDLQPVADLARFKRSESAIGVVSLDRQLMTLADQPVLTVGNE